MASSPDCVRRSRGGVAEAEVAPSGPPWRTLGTDAILRDALDLALLEPLPPNPAGSDSSSKAASKVNPRLARLLRLRDDEVSSSTPGGLPTRLLTTY